MRRFVDAFSPDDRLSQFVVAMTMAANDVEYALHQSGKANPVGAAARTAERRRLG